jgi:hypothetical protein
MDGESGPQCGSDADPDSEMDSPESSASPEDDMSPSSESGSGIASDTDSVETHTLRRKHTRPSSALDTPRPSRRTEDRQPKGCEVGTVASPDASMESLATVAGHCQPRHSSWDIEAARQRVAAQRQEDAKRIRIEQIKQRISIEAWALRQRAVDLERELEEGTALLVCGMEEDKESEEDSGSGSGSRSRSTVIDEDRDEVLSNHSYTPTEVYSDSEQESWTRPPLQQGGVTLHRHHAVPMVISPSQPEPFVTVTREVQAFNDVTGSPAHKVKRYRVRPEDLESLHSDSSLSDMEEL